MDKEQLPEDTKLILINFSEVNISHPNEPDRYLVHKAFNAVIDQFSSLYDNVDVLDIREIVTKETDHTDNIRHYSRESYFRIAESILRIIEETSGETSYSLDGVHDLQIPAKNRIKQLLRKLGLMDIAYKVNTIFHK